MTAMTILQKQMTNVMKRKLSEKLMYVIDEEKKYYIKLKLILFVILMSYSMSDLDSFGYFKKLIKEIPYLLPACLSYVHLTLNVRIRIIQPPETEISKNPSKPKRQFENSVALTGGNSSQYLRSTYNCCFLGEPPNRFSIFPTRATMSCANCTAI